MFVVLLRFSANKTRAADFMQAHNDWIRQGFDDGVFCWRAAFSRARAAR